MSRYGYGVTDEREAADASPRNTTSRTTTSPHGGLGRRIRRIERQAVVQRTAVGFPHSCAPTPAAYLPSRTADFITAPPTA